MATQPSQCLNLAFKYLFQSKVLPIKEQKYMLTIHANCRCSIPGEEIPNTKSCTMLQIYVTVATKTSYRLWSYLKWFFKANHQLWAMIQPYTSYKFKETHNWSTNARNKNIFTKFTVPWQPKYQRLATIHTKKLFSTCYFYSAKVYISTTLKV